MTLPNGADIQIGPYPFNIDRTVGGVTSLIRPHYNHSGLTLVAGRTDISGKPGAQNLDQELLLWIYDTFEGGEGNLVYDSQLPARYDYSNANPRNRGYLTAPPERTDSVASDTSSPIRVVLVNSAGALWCIGGTGSDAFANYTTDGENWTSATITITAGNTISSAAAGGNYVYICAGDETPGSFGHVEVWRVSSTTNDLVTDADFALVHVGMGYQGPWLYGWNGVRLVAYDTTADLPAAGTRVFDSALQTFPDTFYGDLTVGDSGVYFFYSSPGADTQVWYFTGGSSGFASPIWGGPGGGLNGFTGRSIGFVGGVLYLGGTHGNRASLWALDVQSGQTLPIGDFRVSQNTTLTPRSVTAGIGPQVLIGMDEGYVFVYDAEADGISELDQRTQFHNLTAVSTYENLRVAVWRDTDNQVVRASAWGLDDGTVQTDSCYLVTPVWDFDLPMEQEKLLIDVQSLTSDLSATQATLMQVEYMLEESGTWIDAGTKRNGTKHTWPISLPETYDIENGIVLSATNNSVTFAQIRFRFTIAGAPKVYRVTIRAYDTEYIERWELVLMLVDENSGNKPVSRQARAYQVRDWLWLQKSSRALVTFLDGFRRPELSPEADGTPRGWTEHTVIVTDVEDLIQDVQQRSSAEGIVRVTLRNLGPPS